MSKNESEEASSMLTHHVSAPIDQKAPKSLHNSLQDFPSNAMMWLDGYDAYRRAIAQVIEEGVLGMRKWHVTTSFDL